MNDGVYGLFDELPVIGLIDRIETMSPEGELRTGDKVARICFGPTCDSIDRLPGDVMLPSDMQEGDYLVFNGFGAYSTATATRFNGFGNYSLETVYSFNG
jgi:ornithine decarboxylase